MVDSQLKTQCNQLILGGDIAQARELLLGYLDKNSQDLEAWLLLKMTAQSKEMRHKVLNHAILKNPNSVLLQRELELLEKEQEFVLVPLSEKKKKVWPGRILFLCIGCLIGLFMCIFSLIVFNLSIPTKFSNYKSVVETLIETEPDTAIISSENTYQETTDIQLQEDGFYLYDGILVKLPEKNDEEPDQIDTVYHTEESKPKFYVKDNQIGVDDLHLLVYTYGIGAEGNYTDIGYTLARVSEGSPAEAAGLIVGDVLTEVNGKDPTKMLQMMEIDDILRGYPGGWLELEYLRGTTTYSTIVQRSYFLGHPYTLVNVGFSVNPKGDYVEVILNKKLDPGYYHFIVGTTASGLPMGDIRNWMFVVSP